MTYTTSYATAPTGSSARTLFSVALGVAALLLTGCSAGNVLLGDAVVEARNVATSCADGQACGPRVVRAYLDRTGAFYPGLSVSTDLPDRVFASRTQTLRQNFDARMRNTSDDAWSLILAELGTPGFGSTTWERSQSEIRSRLARQVATAAAQGEGPLIVLVHGYNNPDAEPSYARVRERLTELVPEVTDSATFLQITWDGLEAGFPTRVWSEAQFNFPLVGQGIRRLLTDPAFPTDVDVRFLTHSSGGPVVAHALWDAFGAEDLDADECTSCAYRAYLEDRLSDRLPLPPRFRSTRAGMIVPATSESIFSFYDPGRAAVDRLVLGFNPSDYAVTKWIASCKVWGDTCLAARPSYGCAAIERFEGISETDLIAFDFRGYRGPGAKKLLQEEHSLDVYLVRPDFGPFVRALFGDKVVEGEGAAYCEGVEPIPWHSRTESRAAQRASIESACASHWSAADACCE